MPTFESKSKPTSVVGLSLSNFVLNGANLLGYCVIPFVYSALIVILFQTGNWLATIFFRVRLSRMMGDPMPTTQCRRCGSVLPGATGRPLIISGIGAIIATYPLSPSTLIQDFLCEKLTKFAFIINKLIIYSFVLFNES